MERLKKRLADFACDNSFCCDVLEIIQARHELYAKRDRLVASAVKYFYFKNDVFLRRMENILQDIQDMRLLRASCRFSREEYWEILFNEPMTPAGCAEGSVLGVVLDYNKAHKATEVVVNGMDHGKIDVKAFTRFYRNIVEQAIPQLLAGIHHLPDHHVRLNLETGTATDSRQ